MKPKTLWALAIGGALPLASLSCEEYESPGPVAGEGLWSHVPADSMRENVSPHRQREREVAQLEDRVESLRASIDRLEERAQEGERSQQEQELESLRARLEPMERRVAQLRSLVDQPRAFRALRDDMRTSLDEIGADTAAVADRMEPS